MSSKTYFKVTALLAVTICFQSAWGQMVIQADHAMLQPQIQRDSEGFRSCGVRAVVLNVNGDVIDAYDFSLIVDATSKVGMIKAGKSIAKTGDMLKGKHAAAVVTPAPVNFWLVAETDGTAVGPKKFFPSETNGFILAVSDLVPTYKAIVDLMVGERMQFAVRYKSQSLDLVVSFAAEMPEVERKPLVACLNGVRERIAKKSEAKPGNQ